MAKRDTRRNTAISTKAKNRTLQENSSKDMVLASDHMGQKCTGPVHKVGLYASMQLKNGSEVTICLVEEELVKPEVPVLEEEHMAHEKRVWE